MDRLCADGCGHNPIGGAYVSRPPTSDLRPLKLKPIIYSIVNLVIAAWVLNLLRTGGWLTHHYEWNDPNTINFFLMLVEPLVVLGVIAYWIWRTAGLYRVLFISFILQLIVAAGFLALLGWFLFTYKPKMM